MTQIHELVYSALRMKTKPRITENEARKLLDQAVSEAGSQAAFADAHKIARSYVCDVVTGRRDMSGKILPALGLKKIIEFEKIGRKSK